MKNVDKARTLNSIQAKRSEKTARRNQKQQQTNVARKLNSTKREAKAFDANKKSTTPASDSATASDYLEAREGMVAHCLDDALSSEDGDKGNKSDSYDENGKKDENLDYTYTDVEKDYEEGTEGVLRMVKVSILSQGEDYAADLEKDCEDGEEGVLNMEATKDSVSSQGDFSSVEDEKVETVDRASKSRISLDGQSCVTAFNSDVPENNSQPTTDYTRFSAVSGAKTTTISLNKSSETMKVHPLPSSESAESLGDLPFEELKEVEVWEDALNGVHSVGSEEEAVDARENCKSEYEESLNQKIKDLEIRVEMLERELLEVAALEISLYSVVPEHGSSSHKLHTPARRLSRLYTHACKHWSPNKRATVAKNMVSGLIFVVKSCGSDVSRLNFWLSNIVTLREILCEAYGGSTNFTRFAESKRGGKSCAGEVKNLKLHCFEYWLDLETLTSALERIETWIFSRMVESVWWQVFTPHMQSPAQDSSSRKGFERSSGHSLGDQQQGSFSVNLWQNAFQDACQKLCPVRAGRRECGCLPALSRMVMEQCIGRLDVAMFNAILRESEHQIPTDPVSDPILDSKVLPIPAGELSFGSGAQVKNAIGNWFRWLNDMFGVETFASPKEVQISGENDCRQGGDFECKSFLLLNELSDLLMLPKDMLIERSIREEVCPSISLSVIKRILCNFTPDEFCPDPVPGAVLEALNAESIDELRLSGESVKNLPYTAALASYKFPSSEDVAEKVAEVGRRYQLLRNVSMIQRKGYASDEELEELDSPLALIIEEVLPSSSAAGNESDKHNKHTGHAAINARYKLLREVWSA